MRLITDILVALTLLGVLAGITLHYRAARDMEQRLALTESEVQRFQGQISLHAALQSRSASEYQYPTEVDVTWFGNQLPENALLDDSYGVWLEIAQQPDAALDHPRSVMALTRDTARFWYNPYKGIVRARVPGDMSDAAAIQMYNRVNGTSLKSLLGTR